MIAHTVTKIRGELLLSSFARRLLFLNLLQQLISKVTRRNRTLLHEKHMKRLW